MSFLFAGYTSKLPKELESEDFLLLAEGFEAYSGPETIPQDLLSYQVALVSGLSSLAAATASVTEGWRERYDSPIHVELVEYRPNRMFRGVRASLRRLPEGDFYIRLPVVAFCLSSQEARAMAARSIRESLTRQPWQFWR